MSYAHRMNPYLRALWIVGLSAVGLGLLLGLVYLSQHTEYAFRDAREGFEAWLSAVWTAAGGSLLLATAVSALLYRPEEPSEAAPDATLAG